MKKLVFCLLSITLLQLIILIDQTDNKRGLMKFIFLIYSKLDNIKNNHQTIAHKHKRNRKPPVKNR